MAVPLKEKEAIEASEAIIESHKADERNMYHGEGRGYMLMLIHNLYDYGFAVCVKEEEE